MQAYTYETRIDSKKTVITLILIINLNLKSGGASSERNAKLMARTFKRLSLFISSFTLVSRLCNELSTTRSSLNLADPSLAIIVE